MDLTDLRIYMRSEETDGDTPVWQLVIDSARQCGIVESRAIEGLLGVGSRGMIKPSNWVMQRQIPVILDCRGSAESINAFIVNGLALHLRNGTAVSEAYGQLDRGTIEAGLPNAATELGSMLRLNVGDTENYEGTVLHEAIIHIVRGLGCAGATVYRGDDPNAENGLPLVIEVVDQPGAVAELARCIGDIVDPDRIVSKQVAIVRWATNAVQPR